MGYVGALAAGVIGGVISVRFTRNPIFISVIAALAGVLGYTMAPW